MSVLGVVLESVFSCGLNKKNKYSLCALRPLHDMNHRVATGNNHAFFFSGALLTQSYVLITLSFCNTNHRIYMCSIGMTLYWDNSFFMQLTMSLTNMALQLHAYVEQGDVNMLCKPVSNLKFTKEVIRLNFNTASLSASGVKRHLWGKNGMMPYVCRPFCFAVLRLD